MPSPMPETADSSCIKHRIKFDNPEARLAHAFPLDMKSVEVKQMVEATQNTGRPFPEVSQ